MYSNGLDCTACLQATPLEEQLGALSRAVEAGKVRYVGVSNETPWGLMKALSAGEPWKLSAADDSRLLYQLLHHTATVLHVKVHEYAFPVLPAVAQHVQGQIGHDPTCHT